MAVPFSTLFPAKVTAPAVPVRLPLTVSAPAMFQLVAVLTVPDTVRLFRFRVPLLLMVLDTPVIVTVPAVAVREPPVLTVRLLFTVRLDAVEMVPVPETVNALNVIPVPEIVLLAPDIVTVEVECTNEPTPVVAKFPAIVNEEEEVMLEP